MKRLLVLAIAAVALCGNGPPVPGVDVPDPAGPVGPDQAPARATLELPRPPLLVPAGPPPALPPPPAPPRPSVSTFGPDPLPADPLFGGGPVPPLRRAPQPAD